MITQLSFISFVLRDIEGKLQLYAADILFHLYRCHDSLSVKELISFFDNKSPFPVWETIMILRDLGYVESTIKEDSSSKVREKFLISNTGKAKVQIINACFKAGSPDSDFHQRTKSSSSSD
ncbi:MAG TPA: hypothetical protein DIW17_02800 [Clostridiales bacterium]|nr:hypothetical protein [Clostridia bacterium]MDD4680975.1 hypothetical protein [Clostridia bacterium]HCS72788.1 hypothetical protein [Clostridiales bacterium]